MPVCKKCVKEISFDDMHYQTNRSKGGRYMSIHCMDCERKYQLQYKKRKANPKAPLVLPNDHPFSNGRTCNECDEFKRAKTFVSTEMVAALKVSPCKANVSRVKKSKNPEPL